MDVFYSRKVIGCTEKAISVLNHLSKPFGKGTAAEARTGFSVAASDHIKRSVETFMDCSTHQYFSL